MSYTGLRLLQRFLPPERREGGQDSLCIYMKGKADYEGRTRENEVLLSLDLFFSFSRPFFTQLIPRWPGAQTTRAAPKRKKKGKKKYNELGKRVRASLYPDGRMPCVRKRCDSFGPACSHQLATTAQEEQGEREREAPLLVPQ